MANLAGLLTTKIQESVTSKVSGFARGIKAAAISEMPGVVAASGFLSGIRSELQKSSSSTTDGIESLNQAQKVNNVISLEMVRQLKAVNQGVAIQTGLLKFNVEADKRRMAFEEEAERERSVRDDRLIATLGKIGKGPGAANESKLKSSFGDFLGNVLQGMFGGAGGLLGGLLGGAAGGALAGKFGKGGAGGATPPGGPGGISGQLSKFSKMLAPLGILLRVLGRFFLPLSLGLLAYDAFETMFSGPSRRGQTGQQKVTAPPRIVRPGQGTKAAEIAVSKRPSSEDVNPNYTFQAMAHDRKEWDRKYGKTHNPDGTPKTTTMGSFIRQEEGAQLRAYQDAGGYSVGYGHFITQEEIKQGFIDLGEGQSAKIYGAFGERTVLNAEQAEKLFQKDLKVRENEIIKAIGSENYNKLNDNQKEALRSYYYNTGKLPPGFLEAVSTNDFLTAQMSFSRGITTSQGKVLPALELRRKREAILFGIGSAQPSQPDLIGESYAVPGVLSNDTNAGTVTVAGKKVEQAARGASSGLKNRPISGTLIRSQAPINVKDIIAQNTLSRILDTQQDIAKSTRGTFQSVRPSSYATQKARRTQVFETPEQKIIRTAEERFLKQFEATTTRIFNTAITKALFPEGFGVTAQQASGEMYRGQQLAQGLNLNKQTEKFLSKVLGKEYGRMFAPMVSQLGTAYLEVGARQIGNAIFGEGSEALTGQIIGNFRAGKKGLAAEQLLYGVTGVPTGAETLFAKYGFKSAKEGTAFIADYLSAQTTSAVQSITGLKGKPATYKDPRTGKEVAVTGKGFFDELAYTFGIKERPSPLPSGMTQSQFNAYLDRSEEFGTEVSASEALAALAAFDATADDPFGFDEYFGNTIDNTSLTAKNVEKVDKTSIKNTDKTVGSIDEGAERTEYGLSRVEGAVNNLQLRGGAGGGGGGTSTSGDFFDFLYDLGKMYVVNRLTRNIKNPYARAAANYVATKGINYIGDTVIKATTTGATTSTATSAIGRFLDDPIGSIGSLFTSSAASTTGATTAASALPSGMTQAQYNAAIDARDTLETGSMFTSIRKDALYFAGDMFYDFGKLFASSYLTRGIKDPYVRILAQFATNKVIDSATRSLLTLGKGENIGKALGSYLNKGFDWLTGTVSGSGTVVSSTTTTAAGGTGFFGNIINGATNLVTSLANTAGNIIMAIPRALGLTGATASAAAGAPAAAASTSAATSGDILSVLSQGADQVMSFLGIGGKGGGMTGGESIITSGLGYVSQGLYNLGFTGGGNFVEGLINSMSGAEAIVSNSASFTAGQFVGDVLPYADAIIRAFSGDIKGAAGSAIGTYIGGTIGGPIGAAIGSFIGGKLFGSTPKPPAVERVLRVHGNNDINQKTTVTRQGTKVKAETYKALEDFADIYLNIAFNATKMIQQTTGTEPAFSHIGFYVHPDRLVMKLYLPTEMNKIGQPPDPYGFFKYGKPDGMNHQQTAHKILEDIKSKYTKDGASADQISKINEALDKIKKNTFDSLASGLIKDLKEGERKLDTAVSAGIYSTNAADNALIQSYMANRQGTGSRSDSGDSSVSYAEAFNLKTGQYEEASGDNVLLFDEQGRPILDVDGDNMLTESDLEAHRAAIAGVAGVDTSAAIVPIQTNTSASVTPTSGDSSSSGASGGNATVVANSGNQVNNSTVINNTSDGLSTDLYQGYDPLRGYVMQ